MFNGTKDKVFTDTFLKILMTWHINDPVSDRERDINNLVYKYQKNRNPFIDNPEYAQKIWGYNLASKEFTPQLREDIKIYNKSTNTVTVSLENKAKSINKVAVYSINGQMIDEISNKSNKQNIDVYIKNPGVYIIKVYGKQMEINKRIVIK